MKFDENLAVLHGYLCGDGYISSLDKERCIKFSNTHLKLVEDFKKRTENIFNIKRRITVRKVKNKKVAYFYCATKKEVYEELIKYGPYYTENWRLPVDFLDRKGLSLWLRAFFDSEGWLQFRPHQTRTIAAHSLNHRGLLQIQTALKNVFGISSAVKKEKNRKISYLGIYGKDDITKFQKEINFLHTEKRNKLMVMTHSYLSYEWKFPEDKKELERFIKTIIEEKARFKLCRGKPFYIRFFSIIEDNLKKLSKNLYLLYGIRSKIYPSINGMGTLYYELSVQDIDSVKKMLKRGLIKNSIKGTLALQDPYRS